MRYCIWNNKGGVGKTFLTYCIATEYANRHPEKSVVVVDMCPQANVSEMLLGGNGLGEMNLDKCYNDNHTIASYIKSRYDNNISGNIGTETTYFVPVQHFNDKMPQNLYLLPGDNDLDICSLLITHIENGPKRRRIDPWIVSRRFLDDIITAFEKNDKKEKTFFIDTNPSFANYTQVGLIASQRIIVPCTADSASIRGIENIFRLIYDVGIGKKGDMDDDFITFANRLNDIGFSPKIHAFVLNKSRALNKDATIAYRSHVDEIQRIAEDITIKHPECFTDGDTIQKRVFNMKDCNTIAPVINHNGVLPSDLKHDKYPVYDEMAQVNQTQIDPFQEALEEILDNLD